MRCMNLQLVRMVDMKKRKSTEKKLDIRGNPVGDYRGKKWNKKLGRFVYT